MNTLLKKAGLGIALAATALTASAPAEAQRYRGYDHGYRGRDNGGAAIVAGIAGLAIGAAIASDHRDDRYQQRYYSDRGYDYNYDDSYYSQRGYYPNDGYYAYRYRNNYSRCRVERRWDPYYRESVRVRVCR